MASCELCGSETSETTKIKMEGTVLKVCQECSEMGENVSTPSTDKKRSSSSSNNSSLRKDGGKTLATDYGKRLRRAREAESLSQADLADKLNEKESRISKIEKKEFKPGRKLGKKLEAELELELYVTPEVGDHATGTRGDDREATLGDVAEIEDS